MSERVEKVNQALWEEIKACLEDDEDGQGYLWDTCKTYAHRLEAALSVGPVDVEAHRGQLKEAIQPIYGSDGCGLLNWLNEHDYKITRRAQ